MTKPTISHNNTTFIEIDFHKRVGPAAGHSGYHSWRLLWAFFSQTMSTLTVKLPDSLLKTIRRLAKAEGMSVNQFVSSAAGEKMAAWQTLEHLRREAARGRRKDYLKFLDAAGDETPAETDRV